MLDECLRLFTRLSAQLPQAARAATAFFLMERPARGDLKTAR
jgi:hypothetical protein